MGAEFCNNPLTKSESGSQHDPSLLCLSSVCRAGNSRVHYTEQIT